MSYFTADQKKVIDALKGFKLISISECGDKMVFNCFGRDAAFSVSVLIEDGVI